MKFSYNWISEFIDGLEPSAESLERIITIKTAECEGVDSFGRGLAGAVSAEVESVEPIEGSKNVKATVLTNLYGRKTVVCGAPNCRTGLHAVYVPVAPKTVGGIVSDGMLASESDLGVSNDHAGIIELTDNERLPALDHVIEIDNKSITHRPDLWGHHGMAREVAAITAKLLREPANLSLLPEAGGPVKIEIEDTSLCLRYSALVFENVTVRRSPLWLRARLTSIGLNPINNIVDLTNYIMAELAQPMHAFDREKLHGDTIFARPAREGESIIALNDETYELSPSNVVIADASGPIAIAGVIGGRDSAISATTTTIVLESASFQASSVRKTSSALKLRTDASMRFEKAQDPHNTVRALARAIELLEELSPGIRLVGGLADSGREIPVPAPIQLDLDWLARKLGCTLESPRVRAILESLEFKVSDDFTVTIPSWRATKDVATPEDLVEEVGRMIGYDSIEPKAPEVACAPSYDPPEREFLRRVKRTIAAQGFTEVSNYSFISEEDARRFGLAVEDHVRVLNPIAAGQELMRTSLLPGIHRNIVENAKHFDSFRLFETGREIHKQKNAKPEEVTHLMAAIYSKDDGRAALLELKRTAECLVPGISVRPTEPRPWEHPARCAAIYLGDVEVGRLSELHPSLVESGRAAVIDLDLDRIPRSIDARYIPIRKFPSSAFDLSLIAGVRELAGVLENQVRDFAGEHTESVEYVREYQGPPLPAGKKSVTFRILAGAPDRTLTTADITAVRERILNGFLALGYESRE